MNDRVETREGAAARLLRVLDDRARRRRRSVTAPPIAPDVEQFVFDLACPEAMNSEVR